MQSAQHSAETSSVHRIQWWEVCSRQKSAVVVQASNWMSALGAAMAEMGVEDGLDRVACERLMNGVIIVNDISRGERFTISPMSPEAMSEEVSSPDPTVIPEKLYLDCMVESGVWRHYGQDPLISIH